MGISREQLREHGFSGIEYVRQQGSNIRADTDASEYAGSAYEAPDAANLCKQIQRRILEERQAFAAFHGINEGGVLAKIGAANKNASSNIQTTLCCRYRYQVQYPTDGRIVDYNTPVVFAKLCGKLLLHGVGTGGLSAVLESHGARFNNQCQAFRMNKKTPLPAAL